MPGGPRFAAAWWEHLTGWEGPHAGPRSIAELVASDPEARVVLALSATYLAACRHDVTRTIDHLVADDQLSVISVGTKKEGPLGQFLLSCDARLQYVVGGTRQALNVRAVERLLAAGLVGHTEMGEELDKLIVGQPDLIRYNRRPASDSEVRAFIRARLLAVPLAAQTRLLREFRDAGWACEQTRFADLFEAERGAEQ